MEIKLTDSQKLTLLKQILDTETFVLMSKEDRDEYYELNEANILSSKCAKEIVV